MRVSIVIVDMFDSIAMHPHSQFAKISKPTSHLGGLDPDASFSEILLRRELREPGGDRQGQVGLSIHHIEFSQDLL